MCSTLIALPADARNRTATTALGIVRSPPHQALTVIVVADGAGCTSKVGWKFRQDLRDSGGSQPGPAVECSAAAHVHLGQRVEQLPAVLAAGVLDPLALLIR